MGEKDIEVSEGNFTEDITIEVVKEEKTLYEDGTEKIEFTKDVTLFEETLIEEEVHNRPIKEVYKCLDVKDHCALPNDKNLFICDGNGVLKITMPSVRKCNYQVIFVKNISNNYAVKLHTCEGEKFSSSHLEDQFMLAALGCYQFVIHNNCWLCLTKC